MIWCFEKSFLKRKRCTDIVDFDLEKREFPINIFLNTCFVSITSFLSQTSGNQVSHFELHYLQLTECEFMFSYDSKTPKRPQFQKPLLI